MLVTRPTSARNVASTNNTPHCCSPVAVFVLLQVIHRDLKLENVLLQSK
jgi:serine/threonine protein kinase